MPTMEELLSQSKQQKRMAESVTEACHTLATANLFELPHEKDDEAVRSREDVLASS